MVLLLPFEVLHIAAAAVEAAYPVDLMTSATFGWTTAGKGTTR